jgi:hypothetical protein
MTNSLSEVLLTCVEVVAFPLRGMRPQLILVGIEYHPLYEISAFHIPEASFFIFYFYFFRYMHSTLLDTRIDSRCV